MPPGDGSQSEVASFTDAWIETRGLMRDNTFIQSHLLQMRGLKPTKAQKTVQFWASHLLQMRGLKLRLFLLHLLIIQSHLLQMRGLKPSLSAMFERGQIRSHLLQMRGLKLVMLIHLLISVLVASFTDAWIETLKYSRDFIQLRRIFYRCVD